MSVNKLGIILFSGFLMFATAPQSPAQNYNQDTTKKQTAQKGTATKDAGTTEQTKSQRTGKKATTEKSEKKTPAVEKKSGTAEKSTTGAKKAPKTKKSSGLSRDKVRETQTALKKKGFDPGPIDGVMGPMTMAALRNFQSHNGLQVTGNINSETENALMHRTSATSSVESDRSYKSTRESLGLRNEEPVSNLEDVRQVQQALTDLMYNPGEINGMMSSETQQAIREFQMLNNLPITGAVDEQTKIAIDTQLRGGVENAQLGQPSFSADQGREKPGITTESEQSNKTYNQDKDRDKDHDRDAKAHDRNVSGKTDKDAAERVSKAAAVLQNLSAASDKRIPNELLQRAEAIAVIPNMIKGAFGIGGRFGKGVVSQRAENGRWSAPAFIEIGGGSFGAQIGVTSTDLVLVFTDRKAMNMLEGGKDLKLGVDAGIVAGPIGREAEAGVNANLQSAIYAYSRAKGLFAGIALDGAVLSVDKDTNQKVWGTADAKQILDGHMAVNATVRPFMDALDKVVPKKRISQK